MSSLSEKTTIEPAIPSITLLNIPIHKVDMTLTLSCIDNFIGSSSPHHIVTADASMIVMAHQDAQLHSIISKADLITPDSAGILWGARQLGASLGSRVSGVDIVERLCELSPKNGYRIYFFGAGPGVAELAAEKMQTKYAGCRIVGTRNGFFQDCDNDEIINNIRESKADILCVALGIPKQEKWISSFKDRLDVPVLIGVGGTLDVLSGSTRRAPMLFQKARLEWFWRLLSNPKKISKVMLLPTFVQLILQSKKIRAV